MASIGVTTQTPVEALLPAPAPRPLAAAPLGSAPLQLPPVPTRYLPACTTESPRAAPEALARAAQEQARHRLAVRGVAQAANPHPPAAHPGDDHHPHSPNPAALTGEAARASRHLAHGAQELRAAVGLAQAGTGVAAADATAHHPAGLGTSGRVLGGLGVLGGAVQAVDGALQLRAGQTADGARNLAVGGAFTAAGVTELAAPARVAARVAAPLAGAASVLEGGYDVVQGVRHHSTEQTLLGAVKATGGTMLAVSPIATGTVAGAPAGVLLAIGGAALTGGAAVYEAGPVEIFRRGAMAMAEAGPGLM